MVSGVRKKNLPRQTASLRENNTARNNTTIERYSLDLQDIKRTGVCCLRKENDMSSQIRVPKVETASQIELFDVVKSVTGVG